jgi:hypothetical protein
VITYYIIVFVALRGVDRADGVELLVVDELPERISGGICTEIDLVHSMDSHWCAFSEKDLQLIWVSGVHQ